MNIVALLHFAVGCCAVFAGFTALFVTKGSRIHKQAGVVYIASMLLLCLSGFYLSYVRELQFTFVLSAFALYLVITGGLAARPTLPATQIRAKLELAMSGLLCTTCFALAVLGTMLNWPYPATEPPYAGYAFIGVCALLFIFGDIKQIRQGRLTNRLRVTRHLTRMGSSMLIATTVFFLGNNHVLPDSLRTPPVLLMPIITVFVLTIIYRFAYPRLQRSK
ncbi:hypothetical protein P2G88_01250 [Aliiglaciecola sp. CAU 1673]|uniref:hypothetical protein n=1 Tax=Aliiglaciecola sp. CAU 1673 TaxID=3032595 RepID=UPI0023DC1F76|nr:hypothetical protein [Aliiglaciecola sp. CAU 1673]MDF2176877.1 hypothetical protein [Aliiglaciecola sp. CAU 1673]